jgi:ribonuclease HIII
MDILEVLDKIMKKLNKKEKEIIIDMFDELNHLKEENDELIDMFVNEKCFKNVKNKVCRKYKNKNSILDKIECCPLCLADIAEESSSTKDFISSII